MQELRSAFQSGQHVTARGEPWRIVYGERFDEATLLTLRGLGRDNLGDSARLLVPFDRVQPIRDVTRLASRSRQCSMRSVARTLAESPRWQDCWTAATARIELRPWQLEPALAAIGGADRLLLADEVGLGKTIQALLIVSELAARALASRVLVVTPASLREQWADEMSSRFGMKPRVFDQVSLSAMTAALPSGINPWQTASIIVSSIDLIKRPEVRSALDAVPFDVLVVDEAHHLTPGSDRGAVIADLAARTPTVVLVTATPHSGDETAYQFLRSLGRTPGGEDIAVYRRIGTALRAAPERRVHLLPVRPTESERELLESTLRYAKAVWSGPGASDGARLVASTIARRACSSAEAARHTLERRLLLIGGDAPLDPQATLPWEEDEYDDAGVADAMLGVPGLNDRTSEVAWLKQLVRLAADAARAPSKITALRKLLRRTGEHLIVFSEYRDVVQLVGSELVGIAPTLILHGGLSPVDRSRVIRQFNDGGARALVTTDAAGEGLNLHSKCRLVVNLELPWNPLRLEQRMGRVDRLGQRWRVHALHLFHQGSYEDTVLARLERRRKQATAGLTHAQPASEGTIAAAVFEDRPLDPGRAAIVPPAPPPASQPAAWTESERRLNSLAGASSELSAEGPCYATRPRASAASAVALVFTFDVLDRDGRQVQREVVPLRVRTCFLPRRLPRALVRRLAGEPRLRTVLDREIARRLDAAQLSVSRSAARAEHRASAILSTLSSRRHHYSFQRSLFDRREEQRSHTREAHVATWRRHLEHRMNGARALTALTASPARLVAAWLME